MHCKLDEIQNLETGSKSPAKRHTSRAADTQHDGPVVLFHQTLSLPDPPPSIMPRSLRRRSNTVASGGGIQAHPRGHRSSVLGSVVRVRGHGYERYIKRGWVASAVNGFDEQQTVDAGPLPLFPLAAWGCVLDAGIGGLGVGSRWAGLTRTRTHSASSRRWPTRPSAPWPHGRGEGYRRNRRRKRVAGCGDVAHGCYGSLDCCLTVCTVLLPLPTVLCIGVGCRLR